MSRTRWFRCIKGWPRYLSIEERDGLCILKVSDYYQETVQSMVHLDGPFTRWSMNAANTLRLWRKHPTGWPDSMWYHMEEIPTPILEL